MRLSEVRGRVPYSRATIYRLIAAGVFPSPVQPWGARSVAWLESKEVDAWIAARVEAAQMQQGNAQSSRP